MALFPSRPLQNIVISDLLEIRDSIIEDDPEWEAWACDQQDILLKKAEAKELKARKEKRKRLEKAQEKQEEFRVKIKREKIECEENSKEIV